MDDDYYLDGSDTESDPGLYMSDGNFDTESDPGLHSRARDVEFTDASPVGHHIPGGDPRPSPDHEHAQHQLYDLVTGRVRPPGIEVRTLGRSGAGDMLQAVFVDRDRAYNTEAYSVLMTLDFHRACVDLTGYATGSYKEKLPGSRSWLLLIVSVSRPRRCQSLASLLIWRHPGDMVELDAVCGAAHTPEIRQALRLLKTTFEQLDVGGDGSEAVVHNRGRAAPLSLGSLLICLAVRWVMWSLAPDTPRIYLHSVPDAVSRYGTNGFVPKAPAIGPKEQGKFIRDTYGPDRSLESMRRAQDTAYAWCPFGTLYMYMTNDRARQVMRDRCTDTLGLVSTGVDLPMMP